MTCDTGENSYSAFWVGLDGYSSSSVEQIGTDSDCKNGKATYYAWYEMYPKGLVTIDTTISANDSISASVHSNGKGGFKLTITVNGTTTKHFNATFHGAKTSSAEVIAEAPSYNPSPFGAAALTDFGTVAFTDAKFNGQDFTNANSEKIDMVQGSTTKASTSDLGTSGDFAVTWENS